MLRSFISHTPQKFYEADKGDNPDGTSTEPQTGTEPKKTEEKQFSQAELEAIVKDRLARAKRKADDEAQAAKTAAEQKALAEQGEFKTLAEQRATELANAQKELEAAKTHEQAAEQYKQALLSRLAVDKKSLAPGIVALIDKLDPIDQVAWFADPKNAELLKPPATSSPAYGTPPRNAANNSGARNTTAPARQSSDDDRPRFTLG